MALRPRPPIQPPFTFVIRQYAHAFQICDPQHNSVGLDFGIDENAFNAGIGYNTETSPTVDAFARFSYEYIELDAPAGFGSGGDDTAFTLAGFYSFSDAFALGLGASWASDTTAYNVNGRFYFGD